MENKAVIFLPDISGFTKFVTETEIEHSNHIITELIEVIIGSNSLDLHISEIEGDAVLFYLPGKPPNYEKILEQSRNMFLNFHRTLRVEEWDKQCGCGACITSSNLTLKFITHYGACREVPIHTFTKLIGSDVILAHRLLKNNIPEREYLLFSENYLNEQTAELIGREDWINIEAAMEHFENFGDVRVKYIPFGPLRERDQSSAKQPTTDQAPQT